MKSTQFRRLLGPLMFFIGFMVSLLGLLVVVGTIIFLINPPYCTPSSGFGDVVILMVVLVSFLFMIGIPLFRHGLRMMAEEEKKEMRKTIDDS